MRASLIGLLTTSLLAIALGTGCAPAEESAPAPAGTEVGQEQDLTTQTDAALQGKLNGILKDITFTSESDYGYVTLEGNAITEKKLTKALVRKHLAAVIKAKSSDHRDILPAKCRAVRIDVSKAIAEGDSAEVPTNHDDENYTYAHHDKQVAIALKVMRAQLKSVVGFTFGTNESGDQDEFGTVLYVYVGISKTSGKLIAIMTEAVYT